MTSAPASPRQADKSQATRSEAARLRVAVGEEGATRRQKPESWLVGRRSSGSHGRRLQRRRQMHLNLGCALVSLARSAAPGAETDPNTINYGHNEENRSSVLPISARSREFVCILLS